MSTKNPFHDFYSQCEKVLQSAIKKTYPNVSIQSFQLEIPPNLNFGELSSSLGFEIAKQKGINPRIATTRIIKAMDFSEFPLIKSVEPAGAGYINFRVNWEKFSKLTIGSIRKLDTEYGYVKTTKPKKILLEHTSVNPVHPIHIGQARNPVLGDTIFRILNNRGHEVTRHYYVDDVGRQSAVIAYGYTKIGKPKPKEKPDRFIGKIYTITSCIIEVKRLKKQLEEIKNLENKDYTKIQRDLDEWISISSEIEQKYSQLFSELLTEINKDPDPDNQVSKLIRGYEQGKKEEKELLREVCELCLQGFRETLSSIDISIDSWDWESDLIWNGDVTRVIEQLKSTPYVYQENEVLEFDAEKVAKKMYLKKELGISDDHEITPLTLVRGDGTSLYTTRDIAYHLWKFQKAERVINVIGMEQTLPQLQLKLALTSLGHKDYIKRLTHFAYNLVRLPGYRMSSRRGRYITLDEVMDGAAKRALKEVSKRSPSLTEIEKQKISKFVGKGAVKYALVAVDPTKPVVFTWDRVLDFEKNSAPYIQYSHARACSILRKVSKIPQNTDSSLLTTEIERDIILTLARFPEIFLDAAENLKPSSIADYVNMLADKFNRFYTKSPVIKAKSTELSNSRLNLVDATRIVFRNALNLLGIEAPQRM